VIVEHQLQLQCASWEATQQSRWYLAHFS